MARSLRAKTRSWAKWVAAHLLHCDGFSLKLAPFVERTDARKVDSNSLGQVQVRSFFAWQLSTLLRLLVSPESSVRSLGRIPAPCSGLSRLPSEVGESQTALPGQADPETSVVWTALRSPSAAWKLWSGWCSAKARNRCSQESPPCPGAGACHGDVPVGSGSPGFEREWSSPRQGRTGTGPGEQGLLPLARFTRLTHRHGERGEGSPVPRLQRVAVAARDRRGNCSPACFHHPRFFSGLWPPVG